MKNIKNKHYKFGQICLIIGIFLFITWTLSTNLYIDESFTLGLIKHNWSQIITLDSMDVHPPLYYLIVKLFLVITTFWTTSMPIKVIFARLFSVICYAITIKGCQLLINNYLKIKVKFIYLFFGLLLLPSVLYHATCIRMYSFGAALITWELVFLQKYIHTNHGKYLIYTLLCAEAAAYTHYFAAIIGGLLILYEFINAILTHKKFKNIISLCLTGIALLILFIPWGIIATKQVISVGHSYWIKNNIFNYLDIFYYRGFPIQIFTILGAVILLIATIICYIKGNYLFKYLYQRILFGFYGAFLIGIIVSICVRPMFQARYLFFIFPLYLTFTILELMILFKNKPIKVFDIIATSVLSLGIAFNTFEGICNIKRDCNVINYLHEYTINKNKDIILPFSDPSLTVQYSLYLPSKNIIAYDKEKLISTIQTGNYQKDIYLFNKLYSNFQFRNKK